MTRKKTIRPPDTTVKTSTRASVGSAGAARSRRTCCLPVTRAVLAALAALLIAAPAAPAAASCRCDLPGDVTASSVRADPDTWLVGAAPGKRSAELAQRFGRDHFGLGGTASYQVARARARVRRRAAGRRLLVYARPTSCASRCRRSRDDPLSARAQRLAREVADPALTPPPVTPAEPADRARRRRRRPHPPGVDAATRTSPRSPGTPVTNPHGTATASVAAAPQNGDRHPRRVAGRAGAQRPAAPSGRTARSPARPPATRSSRPSQSGASVINMSYGSPRAARRSGCRSTSRSPRASSRSRPPATSSRTATRSSSRPRSRTSSPSRRRRRDDKSA